MPSETCRRTDRRRAASILPLRRAAAALGRNEQSGTTARARSSAARAPAARTPRRGSGSADRRRRSAGTAHGGFAARPAALRRRARRADRCGASPARSVPTGATGRSASGSLFHTLDGEPYWDERAYYAFTLEGDRARPRGADRRARAMCRELVARAVDDERMLRLLQIPERVLELHRGELEAPRPEPLRPVRSELRRQRARPSCSNTMPTRRPRCSRPPCSSGCGSRRRSPAASSRTTPTSTIRCTSA